MREYRFDNNYSLVYKYNKNNKCYICIGNYYMFNITKKMSYNKAKKQVENTHISWYFEDSIKA